MVLLGTPKTPPRTSPGEQTPQQRHSGSSAMLRMLRRGNSTERGGGEVAPEPGEFNISEVAPEPGEFSISVDKSTGSSLGLGLDPSMVVTQVDGEGLVAAWNGANPGKEVKVGHRIVQVNGKSEQGDIVEKLKAQELLELRFSSEVVSDVAETARWLDLDPHVDVAQASVGEALPTEPPADPGGMSAMKAWVTEVSSEETPSPGMRSIKNKFDASNEFNAGADGKDGDLVELPSPSIHTSLLSHSSLSPSPRDPLSSPPARDNGTSWTVASPGPSPMAPGAMASPVMGIGSTSTCPPTSAPIRSIASPPDDNEGYDIAPVHSSLTTSSPSFHSLRQDMKTSRPYVQEATVRAAETPGNNGMEDEELQLHGQGDASAEVGFLGAGPFWTCGSTPNPRIQQGHVESSSSSFVSGLFTNASQSASSRSSGELSTHISGLIGNCINMLANAIDLPNEPEPPEDELTTVLMETKEQRLQWRDFLSEAVSKCHAGSLYASFDVEPVPPKYARPPLSMAPKVDAFVISYRQTGKTPPRVVAPRGAGFSSTASLNPCLADDKKTASWAFSGGLQVDPEVDLRQDISNGDTGAAASSSSSRPPTNDASQSELPQRSVSLPDRAAASSPDPVAAPSPDYESSARSLPDVDRDDAASGRTPVSGSRSLNSGSPGGSTAALPAVGSTPDSAGKCDGAPSSDSAVVAPADSSGQSPSCVLHS